MKQKLQSFEHRKFDQEQVLYDLRKKGCKIQKGFDNVLKKIRMTLTITRRARLGIKSLGKLDFLKRLGDITIVRE